MRDDEEDLFGLYITLRPTSTYHGQPNYTLPDYILPNYQ